MSTCRQCPRRQAIGCALLVFGLPALNACDATDWFESLVPGRLRSLGPVAPNVDAGTSLASATPLPVPPRGQLSASGEIRFRGDVATYALGPAAAGDRFTVDVSGDNGLNTVAALFNDRGELIDANDDRSYYGGQVDPFLGVTIREDASNLVLAVCVSRAKYFASDSGRFDSGTFRLRVQRTPGVAFAVTPQVVWVEFNGATGVRIAQEAAIDVLPFDAVRISPRLAESGAWIKDSLMARLRAELAPFGAAVLRSDQDRRPVDPYTTILVGGFSTKFLGLSDNVDSYNANPRQRAIVFAETLALFEYLRPSPEDTARALANIAGHELGHLLGLEHTSDPNDLMAPAASAQQIFFVDAHYGVAPLDSDLFPLGVQNEPMQLGLALGWREGSPFPADLARARPAQPQSPGDDEPVVASDNPAASRGFRAVEGRPSKWGRWPDPPR